MRRNCLAIDTRQVVWCMTMKVAHTSIAEVLRGSNTTKHYAWDDEFPCPPHYFRFVFVRNPWDRVVSTFAFMQQDHIFCSTLKKDVHQGINKSMGFESFVNILTETEDETCNPHIRSQHCELPNHLDPPAHFIGKFENLDSDWQLLRQLYGFPLININRRKSVHQHYSEYYTERTRTLIRTRYSEDVKRFGYSFKSNK